MKIRTRMCMSLDGYVTTPDGWPAQLAEPTWSPEAYGFREFQAECAAVLMGRTTFEPALGAERWPWPGVGAYVLASHRPAGTPDDVVVESDPQRLLERLRETHGGGDVHLIGGPRTIEAFRRIGALDELGVIVLPLLLGDGLRLTPAVGTDARLRLLRREPVADGAAIELVYACD
jgi:dihydrofolate reductase